MGQTKMSKLLDLPGLATTKRLKTPYVRMYVYLKIGWMGNGGRVFQERWEDWTASRNETPLLRERGMLSVVPGYAHLRVVAYKLLGSESFAARDALKDNLLP